MLASLLGCGAISLGMPPFPKRGAAMLGQFRRLIQSNEAGLRQFRLHAHFRVQNSEVEILSDKAGMGSARLENA